MIAETAQAMVMPTWVFLLIFVGGTLFVVFLMWANNTQAHDLRRERYRRQVHDHLHHDGPEPVSLLTGGEQ